MNNYDKGSTARIPLGRYEDSDRPSVGCAEPAPSGVLIAALVRMQELEQCVNDQRHLVGRIVDRVFGPVPTSDGRSAGKEVASGLGDAMHLTLSGSFRGLGAINENLNRLLQSVEG